MRYAIGYFLQVMKSMQLDIRLLGATIRNTSTDTSEFQILERTIDLEKKGFLF
jgi:hypothetical protein